MLFKPPPILGSVHKISLCQSPAQPPGLLPATQHPQSDPQPNFSLGSRQFSSGTIVHLRHLTQKVNFLHFISVLFLFSLAVGLTSAHLGSSKGGSGLGIYRLDQAQPESRQATSTCPFPLSSPYLPYSFNWPFFNKPLLLCFPPFFKANFSKLGKLQNSPPFGSLLSKAKTKLFTREISHPMGPNPPPFADPWG